jgi:hypothetical protein
LRRLLALNVIHGASKVWSLSDRLTQMYGPAVRCKKISTL